MVIGTFNADSTPNAMNIGWGGQWSRSEIVNIVCDEEYIAEDGKPDVEKMHLLACDPVHYGYGQFKLATVKQIYGIVSYTAISLIALLLIL